MTSPRHLRALVLAAPILVGLAVLQPLAGERQSEWPQAPPASASIDGRLQTLKIADAVRAGDFTRVRTLVEPLSQLPGERGAEASVLLGLYAWLCGEPEEARRLLLETRGYVGRFGDLRLEALAESATESGHLPAAEAAWGRLLADYPQSAFRRRALVGGVEAAYERGDLLRAVSLIDESRNSPLDAETTLRLDTRAWEIADELESDPLRRAVARRLLVEHPLTASKLEVVEVFRLESGEVPWAEILTADEIVTRARMLLGARLPDNALTTLDSVAEGDRDLEWTLVRAEALTRAHRGLEALELLDGAEPRALESHAPETQARWEWRRALAALDVSTARRDRADLPSDERAAFAASALEHLERVTRLDPAGTLEAPALKLWFLELAEDDERFDEALTTLKRLREVAPSDTTGARKLWGLGWSQYLERNDSGAIGYWSELLELYPESHYARSGLYWTGRAHQKLGAGERGAEILERVANVEVDDFYRRHALLHLDQPVARAGSSGETLPWPRDPVLDRAQLFTDLGLDAAALVELRGVASEAEPRARFALEAVVLAHLGERRKSIGAVSRAFPDLGSQRQGRVPSRALDLYYPRDFETAIARHAAAQNLPTHLVFAMIRQESAFDAGATSFAGARGLMQLMPATGIELARRLGLRVDRSALTQPEISVQLGTAYFRQVLEMFSGNDELALAGYNGGPYRIKRLLRSAGGSDGDQFLEGLGLPETRSYVKRVLLFADSYRARAEASG